MCIKQIWQTQEADMLIVSWRKLRDGDTGRVENFSLVQTFVPFGF